MVRAYEARGGADQLTELNRFLTGLSWSLSLVEALRRQRAALLERFASCRKSWMRSEASEVMDLIRQYAESGVACPST